MTSIDIKLKALISILSGFQFLHPCEHTLILLHNCPILTGRIMQPCVTATSMSCHSPDLLHLSPLANSNTRSSYPHSQPGAAETAPPAPSTQMDAAHPPQARASPTEGKTPCPKAVWGEASLSHNSSSSFKKATTQQLHPG